MLMITAAIEFITPNNFQWFAVAMGIGTVFIGLVCIVILCMVTSLFFKSKEKGTKEGDVSAPAATAVPAAPAVIENRQEIIAAVTAAVAEEMGTEVSALRVVSFKKL